MQYRYVIGFASALCAVTVLGSGCVPRQPKVGPPEAAVTPVSQPLIHEITDYVEFTGRTDAVHAVDIRARVTGYLNRMPFTEGSEVKEGDLLFEIDPRPYQAQLEQAEGQVKLYQSSLELARITYNRDRDIARTPGAVSQQQLDQDVAAVKEAEARVNAYKASLDIYKLNLQFTKVRSPIDGRISRYYLTKGNLVIQDQTLLTTVVSLDPMYVYFDMDEPTLLRIRSAINTGLIQRRRRGSSSSNSACRRKPTIRTPASSTSSTTRSTRTPAASRCGPCCPIRGRSPRSSRRQRWSACWRRRVRAGC